MNSFEITEVEYDFEGLHILTLCDGDNNNQLICVFVRRDYPKRMF